MRYTVRNLYRQRYRDAGGTCPVEGAGVKLVHVHGICTALRQRGIRVSYAGSTSLTGLPAAVVTAAVHAGVASSSAYTVAVPAAIATRFRSAR